VIFDPEAHSMESGDLRMAGAIERGRAVTIRLDGDPLTAYEGETVAAALLAVGRRTFRTTVRGETPRSYYCGMGVCHDCLVTVDGLPNVRACMTPVRDGLVVLTQRGLGEWGGER
jgi:predicted molibdopterin-dependent oxidoreductase YjgC